MEIFTFPFSNIARGITMLTNHQNTALTKIKDFLENEYLCKCTDKIGLNSLSGGSTIYKGLLEEQTMKGYTPKDIHNLGLREVKRLMNKIHSLKRFSTAPGVFRLRF